MKKKIALIVACSMMFGGAVSAASLWGTYKGNQIIRLTVNGNPISVSDVPAVSLNGRTMVPVYLLKQAGVNYSWDASTQTVNIIPSTNSAADIDPSKVAQTIISLGGGGVTITNVASATTAITYFQAQSNFSDDWPKLSRIFAELIKYNATYSRIVYADGTTEYGYVEGLTQDFKNFINGTITAEQLSQKVTFHDNASNGIFNPNVPTTTSSTSDAITSTIDGDFNGFDNGNIFKLSNGQIWEQTDYTYHYSYKYSPKVTIYKDGSQYKLIVDGVDKTVTVERLK